MSVLHEANSFHEDMISVHNRLPDSNEFRRVRSLELADTSSVSDEQLAHVLRCCPHLERVDLPGVSDLSDRTIVLLASNATNLREINISGCQHVTDVGVLELLNKSLPLQCARLNGVALTDPCVSAIAKSCSRLVELELCHIPLLSPLSVRDVWSFSRKLRTLRLAYCPLLSDKAFPSYFRDILLQDEDGEKPLPPRPTTWLDKLPPLILRHKTENLRVLDLAFCKITDGAIEGIVMHAPKIQTLNLSGCSSLTDRALDSISLLGDHLDVLLLAHVPSITDAGVVQIARACTNLRCVDVAFCRNLTDMSVFELAGLSSLRRLSLVRVHKLTDIAIFALAEHATALERLQISYCDKLSLEALHLLLCQSTRLEHLSATGIPSLKRRGVERFSDSPPPEAPKSAFRVFSGKNLDALRRFLDKEEGRRREAEAKNIPFIPRSDDKFDLY